MVVSEKIEKSQPLCTLQLTDSELTCYSTTNVVNAAKHFSSLIDVYYYLFIKAYVDEERDVDAKDVYLQPRRKLNITRKKYKLQLPDKEVDFPLDFREYEKFLELVKLD